MPITSQRHWSRSGLRGGAWVRGMVDEAAYMRGDLDQARIIDVARARYIHADVGDHGAGMCAQHDDPVRKIARLLDVVGGEQDGAFFVAAQRHEFLAQARRSEFIERREWLVHQEEIGVDNKRTRPRHPLLHTAPELSRKVAGPRADAHAIAQLAAAPAPLAPSHPPPPPPT